MFGWRKKKKTKKGLKDDLLEEQIKKTKESFEKLGQISEEIPSTMAKIALKKDVSDIEYITNGLKIKKNRSDDDEKAIKNMYDFIESTRTNIQDAGKKEYVDKEEMNELYSKLDKQKKVLDSLQ